jgi:hypothetical protein
MIPARHTPHIRYFHATAPIVIIFIVVIVV